MVREEKCHIWRWAQEYLHMTLITLLIHAYDQLAPCGVMIFIARGEKGKIQLSMIGQWWQLLYCVQKDIDNRCHFSLLHGVYSLLLLGIPSGTGSQRGMQLSQWDSWHRGNRKGNFEQGWGHGWWSIKGLVGHQTT